TSSLSRLKRKDAWFGGSKSNIKLQTAPSVSKGKPTAVQKHSLPSSAPGTLPSETLMLQITNLEALVDEPSQTKSFYFDPLLPIERCVKRILKTYPFSLDVGQFGFFDVKQSTSPEGRWLDNKRTFASYQLQNNDILEFKKRYISYGVSLAGNLKPYYQFDARATVGQLREIIEHNYLETGLIKDAARGSEYGLYIPGDHEGELENRRSLFSYNILNMQLIEYRRRLQPLTIFEAGRQAVFQVDYLKPLGLLEAEVCAKFLLERFDQSSCSLQQHGIIGVSVNLNQSLVYQNIRPPATLIMKVNRAPSASSEAQQDDPSMLTNIYEEPDDERFIKYEKAPTATTAPVIMACSFNKIVTHLTHEKWSDLSFMGALLLTFRVFTTPSNLLQKLIERYNAPVCLPKAESAVIKLRVLNFLRKWVIDWPQDFEGGAKDILIDFVQFQVTNAPDVSSVSKSTCLKIVKKLTQDQQPGSTVRRKAPKASRSLRTTVFIGNAVDKHGSIFDFPEDDIAAELTRIDTDIYQGLSASEFLGQNWAKEATQMKCPTIMEMITRFNAISMWVAFLILEPVGFQLRAKRFEKLIRIADVLLERNNFQTLMAFLGGMNNASVSRLKFTKEVLSKKAVAKLTELEKLMNMESSYAKYREALTQRQPPIIPYVGVYLSDLTFVEDGNPDQIDGLINFSKYQLAYDTISKIETYKVVKSTPSPSPENTEICRVLLDIPLHSEKQLYEMSLEREPRGAVKCTP
ncbi:MAG: RasGEF domain-containing protein, partial [archaeon]|nr:RasGEF domain-containing protein [archaeon]